MYKNEKLNNAYKQFNKAKKTKKPIWPYLVLIAILIWVLMTIGSANAKLTRTVEQDQIKQEQLRQNQDKLKKELKDLQLKQDNQKKELDQKIEKIVIKKEQARLASVPIVKKPAPAPIVQIPPSVGSHTDWMVAAGIDPANFGYVDYIITKESGWGVTRWHRGGSGAYGLGQALPARKMAPYGADYMTNPVTQLRWAQAYAIQRYGSWYNAYLFWTKHYVW